jgi:hypothetical protein
MVSNAMMSRMMVSAESRSAVEAALEEARKKLPKYAEGLEYEIRPDYSGDPAVHITVSVNEEMDTKPGAGRQMAKLSWKISQMVFGHQSEIFPYVTFHTVSKAPRRRGARR